MANRLMGASLVSLSVAVVLALSACGGRPQHVQIMAASISAGDSTSNERVLVRLTAGDVMALAEQEIYSHIVVFECENDAVRYPASPRIGDTPLDNFSAVRNALESRPNDQTVDIEGDVLSSFLDRLIRICVKMDGGSYMGRDLSSNIIPVRRSR